LSLISACGRTSQSASCLAIVQLGSRQASPPPVPGRSARRGCQVKPFLYMAVRANRVGAVFHRVWHSRKPFFGFVSGARHYRRLAKRNVCLDCYIATAPHCLPRFGADSSDDINSFDIGGSGGGCGLVEETSKPKRVRSRAVSNHRRRAARVTPEDWLCPNGPHPLSPQISTSSKIISN
jgi:hypothetical protein